jgi:hypothetical protein
VVEVTGFFGEANPVTLAGANPVTAAKANPVIPAEANPVIPAQAGIQGFRKRMLWVPAFAGMTMGAGMTMVAHAAGGHHVVRDNFSIDASHAHRLKGDGISAWTFGATWLLP